VTQSNGPKVRQGKHPRGRAGVNKSIDEIVAEVEKGRVDPKTVAWARETWARAGRPRDKMQLANAILLRLRKERGYIEDPVDAEFVTSSACLLDGCEGLTFFGEDCDGLLIAFLASCEAVGIEAAVLNHIYNQAGDEHVLAALYDRPAPGEDRQGRWVRCDPSTSQPFGTVSEPMRERMFLIPGGKMLCDSHNGFCPDNHLADVGAVRENLRPEGGEFVGVGAPFPEYVGEQGTVGANPHAEPFMGEVSAQFHSFMLDQIDKAFEEVLRKWEMLVLHREEMGYVVYTLGGELIQQPEEGKTNWTPALEQQYQNLRYIVPTYLAYLDEARRGERDIVWDSKLETILVTGKVGETAIVDVDGDVYAVDSSSVDTSNGSVSGAVGNPMAIGGIVVVGLGLVAVCTYLQYLLVEKIVEGVSEICEAVKVSSVMEWSKKRVDAGEDSAMVQKDAEKILADSGGRLEQKRKDASDAKEPLEDLMDTAKLGLTAFVAVGSLAAVAYGISQVAKMRGRS